MLLMRQFEKKRPAVCLTENARMLLLLGVERHLSGSHGIVGGPIPLGVGIAFSGAYREDDQPTRYFYSNGAVC